jgi:hypothetical protein
MAPPFLKGVVVGPKVGVEVRKTKSILEIVPHPERIPILKNHICRHLRCSLAKLARSTIGPSSLDEASAGNVPCVLILCVYNFHITPSIVLHLSTENLLIHVSPNDFQQFR